MSGTSYLNYCFDLKNTYANHYTFCRENLSILCRIDSDPQFSHTYK